MAEGSRLDLSLHQVGRIVVVPLSFSSDSVPSVCLLDLLFTLRLTRCAMRKQTRVRWLIGSRGDRMGPGGESGVVPPVPMPNTVVKRSSADDTGVIKPRENRPVPGPFGRYTNTNLGRSARMSSPGTTAAPWPLGTSVNRATSPSECLHRCPSAGLAEPDPSTACGTARLPDGCPRRPQPAHPPE